MAKRLENNFQFLDVPRFAPTKKDIATRSPEFVEIINLLKTKLLLSKRIVVLSVVTRTASGNAQYTTIFLTG